MVYINKCQGQGKQKIPSKKNQQIYKKSLDKRFNRWYNVIEDKERAKVQRFKTGGNQNDVRNWLCVCCSCYLQGMECACR